MVMIMIMKTVLFSLSKIQNYMSLKQIYRQKILKNYRNFLAKDLKDQLIEMNIKQNARMKIQQMNRDIFLNQVLFELMN